MTDPCRRLLREAADLLKHPETDIKLEVSERSIFEWTAEIEGPPGTPYAGGRFKMEIKCPPIYPMVPPYIIFKTPVFHPNVQFHTGEICLDVLKSNWSPAWTLASMCRGLMAFLSDPNADSPLNCDAGNLVRSGDLRGFRSLARMYTVEFAQS